MIDKFTDDIDDFVNRSERRLEKKALTLEQTSLEMLEDRIQSELTQESQRLSNVMKEFQEKQFRKLTMDMQGCFVRAEEVSSTKLFAIQSQFIKDNMEVNSRLMELEANGIKDRTLTSEQLREATRHINLVADTLRLTKEEDLAQKDESISRYLEMNEVFRMTLEAHVNDKFEVLENTMKQVIIQGKDTNLENKLSSLLVSMEDLQKQSEARELRMHAMIQEYQTREIALEDKLVVATSSVTNLEGLVKDLEAEVVLLREQAGSNQHVNIREQLEETNAPTGKQP
jgi:hypothetical protein